MSTQDNLFCDQNKTHRSHHSINPFEEKYFEETFGQNSANYNLERFFAHRNQCELHAYVAPTIDIGQYDVSIHNSYKKNLSQVLDGGFCFLSVDTADGLEGIAAVDDYLSNIPEITQKYHKMFAKDERLSMEGVGKFGRVPFASVHSHVALNQHNKNMYDKYLSKFQTAIAKEMSTRDQMEPVVGVAFFNTSKVSQPIRCIPGLLMTNFKNNEVCNIEGDAAIRMTVDMMTTFHVPPGQIAWMNELVVHALHNNTACRMTRIMYEFAVFPVRERDGSGVIFIAHRWSEVYLCKQAHLKFSKKDARPHSDCCKQTTLWSKGKTGPILVDPNTLDPGTNTIYKGSAIIGSISRSSHGKKVKCDKAQTNKSTVTAIKTATFEGYLAGSFAWMCKKQRDLNTIHFTCMFGPVSPDGFSIMKNRVLSKKDEKDEIIPWPAVNQTKDGKTVSWRSFVHEEFAAHKFGESVSYDKSKRMKSDYTWVEDETNRLGYTAEQNGKKRKSTHVEN